MSTQLPNEFETNIQKKPARALGGWILLAIAILAGLGAAYLAVSTLKSREQAALERLNNKQNGETIRAVVPIQDVPAGAVLDLAMVAARPIPADTAPSDVITPEMFDRYAGHRVNVPLVRGRPILTSYLSARRTLADMIDPQKLAMTFTVDNISAFDGMLQPGDHVDVLWFYTGNGGTESRDGTAPSFPRYPTPGANGDTGLEGGQMGASGATTGPVIFRTGASQQGDSLPKESVRYLERDLKIIATGTRTVGDDSAANNDPAQGGQPAQFNTVTVELSPQQIQKLSLAKRLGELQLVLRSRNSQVVTPGKVYSVRDILGLHGHPGGTLYAADAIEYIIGNTQQSGRLLSQVDLQNIRRVRERPVAPLTSSRQ
ncbi:MAG: Flp pilus assembly protein CpaB [Acidithiobacillus sp.]|nr:Flp pilus assembly protein CpaB [Acidithiobacillus sp.]